MNNPDITVTEDLLKSTFIQKFITNVVYRKKIHQKREYNTH